jgi:hypothetical protein
MAAAVIPTLMIAVAVGMKRGHSLAETSGDNEVKILRNLNVVMALYFMIGAGEVNALLAVATNGGTAVQGYWAYTGIILAFAQLGYELVMPVVAEVEGRGVARVVWFYTLALPFTALLYGQAIFFGPDYDASVIAQRWLEDVGEWLGWLADKAETIKENPVYSL